MNPDIVQTLADRANLDHFDAIIEVMQDVVDRDLHFSICEWIEVDVYGLADTQEHTCGTAACICGFVALHPITQALGWSYNRDRDPVFQDKKGAQAVELFLFEECAYHNNSVYEAARPFWSPGYYSEALNKHQDAITALDVLTHLKELRAEVDALKEIA